MWRTLALLVCACSSKPSAPADKISGTLERNGTPLAIERCLAGRGATTFVELVTPEGKLRFEEAQLFWTDDRAAVSRGTALACEKLDRSWGGGQRTDGTSYFRGMLDFRCTGAGSFTGKVEIECGKLTAEERKSLDEGRARARAGSGDPPPP
jgi:hypothetical protein